MSEFKEELNKEQLRIVREGDGPCLVLSGPGSGKTKTLVHRTAYLIKKGIPPSRILLLTFTKKAAKEMLFRIKLLAGKEGGKVYGGTFHHTGNYYLRKYAGRIGYPSNFVILDEEDSKSLLSIILKEEKEKGIPKAQVVQKIISLAVNSQKDINSVISTFFPYFDKDTKDVISNVNEVYKKRKKQSNLMDYDDLLLNWNEILSFPDIGKEISSNFLYILIDEYQDTNSLQDDIAKKLATAHKNILAVGDDSQSIYSFRAADINNILNFSKNYTRAKVFKLETNYRSTPEILDAANRVIANNENKLEKKLKSSLMQGKAPTIKSFASPYDQARYIVNRIEEINDPAQTAVLFRAHHHSIELEMELVKRKIPYGLRGGPKFFEQLHVKDLLAFLKILSNFCDETSWHRLLMRQEGIGDVYASQLTKRVCRFKDLKSVLLEKEKVIASFSSKSVKNGIDSLLSIIEKSRGKTVAEAIECFLQDFYGTYLDFSFENAKERKSDLQRVKELAKNYNNVEEMLAEFMLSEEYGNESKNENTIILSSIHQAKGLEWESVFVISLKEGDLPHGKSLEDNLIEEERRLFYVAITRCKKNLFLTYPVYSSREKYTSSPSRFLREIKEIEKEEEIIEEEIIDEDGEWEYF